MKTIIIMLCMAVLAAMGAYWAGSKVGAEKCRSEMANLSNNGLIAIQNKITESKGRINAETFNTGVSDIRHQLHKYWAIRD